MKNFLVGGLSLFLAFDLSAAIASWSFNSGIQGSADAGSLNANVTSATLTTTPNTGGSLVYQGIGGDPGGYIVVGGSQAQVAGSTLQFALATANADFQFGSLSLHYLRGDPLGSPTAISWSYSIAGGAPNALASTLLPDDAAWQTTSLDLSAIHLNPSQSLALTGTLNSGGTPGFPGDLYFDTFSLSATVTPVPEPVHYAMGLFGLIFAGGSFARHLYRRMRAR